MLLRTLLGILLLLAVVGGAFAYMARRSMALCPPLGRHPGLTWGFFGLFFALLFLVPLVNRLLDHRADALYALSYGLFGLVSTYLLLLLAADLIQALLRRFLHAPDATAAWAVFMAIGASLLACAWGAATALGPPPVRTLEVPVKGLPPGLEGLRIVQISDFHLGPLVSHASIQRLLGQVEELRPDLIAVTGDLVDGEADGVRAKVERLGALKAPHGIFFVTGNHEYYSGVDRWLPVLRDLGWKVLMNEHAVVERSGATLVVAGLPDPASRGRRGGGQGPDLTKALAGAPQEAVKVLLFHPPTGVEAAERAGIALQLSGHTHGGQYFPWSLVIPAFYRYPRGLSRQGGTWVYTSVGTGYWGPPNRFLVPPELTILVLRQG